jgi:ribosomal protein L19E
MKKNGKINLKRYRINSKSEIMKLIIKLRNIKSTLKTIGKINKKNWKIYPKLTSILPN